MQVYAYIDLMHASTAMGESSGAPVFIILISVRPFWALRVRGLVMGRGHAHLIP